MGKEKPGFLTPKAIANRIKSKGLQKLRWYCQMCQKQCRDENGFKCHAMSESHQRQLLLVAENPQQFVGTFSYEFFKDFIQLLKTRFGTKRIQANVVYQEYISDRNHLHMNATQWVTLTGFVKWLGRKGHCVVDQNEKGWFIQYIDRDPETIARQEAIARKEKMALDDEERIHKFIEKQVKKDQEKKPSTSSIEEGPNGKEFLRESEEEKITFTLAPGSKVATAESTPSTSTSTAAANVLKVKKEADSDSAKKKEKSKGDKRKLSALQEIIMEEESRKKRGIPEQSKSWLAKGIVLKIVSRKYGENLYKQKGVVKTVEGGSALLKLLDPPDQARERVSVEQQHLETVIPALGKDVQILQGPHRGEVGSLQALDEGRFSVSVRLAGRKGKVVEGIPYENVSKVYSS